MALLSSLLSSSSSVVVGVATVAGRRRRFLLNNYSIQSYTNAITRGGGCKQKQCIIQNNHHHHQRYQHQHHHKINSSNGIIRTKSSSISSSNNKSKTSIQTTTTTTTKQPPPPSKNSEPTSQALYHHALSKGIPFIGFGIMDNAILIYAGDMIDVHLGVLLGISTLCAAAIGNIISDVAGVMLGTVIEDVTARFLNVPIPKFTHVQRELRSVRFAGQLGIAIGLTIGCIIGMFPLLFLDTDHKKNKVDQQDKVLHDIILETKKSIKAETICLFLVVDNETSNNPSHHTCRQKSNSDCRGDSDSDSDSDSRHLYRKYMEGREEANKNNKSITHRPIGNDIVSKAVLLRESINSVGSYDSTTTQVDKDQNGFRDDNVDSTICVPILDIHGNVIAVIQAINKLGTDSSTIMIEGENMDNNTSTIKNAKGFTLNDIGFLQGLSTHLSIMLHDIMYENKKSISAQEKIKMLEEYALSGKTKVI